MWRFHRKEISGLACTFLVSTLADPTYGVVVRAFPVGSPPPPPISDETHKVERQGDLILSGEDGGEGGRLFCPKSVIWSLTGVYARVYPQITGSIGTIPHLAPSLGTSREGLVALMVGLARVRYRPGLSVSLWLMIIIIGTLFQCSKEVKLNIEGLTFPRKQICQVICLPEGLRR